MPNANCKITIKNYFKKINNTYKCLVNKITPEIAANCIKVIMKNKESNINKKKMSYTNHYLKPKLMHY